MISLGRRCDNCGKNLKEEDFDRSGSWNYTCPKCDFRYKHGLTKLDDDDDED